MNQAYICDAIRTPFGRYGGALSSVRTDDLGAIPLKALIARNPKVDWQAVDDVLYGCANQAGEDNRNVGRMSALLAGLPVEVPAATINRLCGSGMDAVGTRGARDQERRSAADDRRRRREHEPRAVRDAEGRDGVLAQQCGLRHDDRLALRQQADEAAVRHRLDARDRRERRRRFRHRARGAGPDGAGVAAEGARRAALGLLRRRDHAGQHRAEERRAAGRREGRTPARDQPRGAGAAEADRPRRRHA